MSALSEQAAFSREPFARAYRWKTGLSPLEEAGFDVGALLVVWLVSGATFFCYCDVGWTPLYAWFFAVNAGLGVGYGDKMPTIDSTKYFTVAFSLVGTSLIMGGLGGSE